MEFNSIQFLIFFPLVTIMYFNMPKVLKKPWLLVCSYYFYMCWNPAYSLLILFSTVSTYLCGFLIDISKHKAARKWALGINIAVNIGILFFFKYFNFISQSVCGLLSLAGMNINPLLLDTDVFILPVGISFYTFQALGYSIDVYRGDIKHEKSFVNYALFVSFFPQLVAGPIERAKNFLPQLHMDHTFEYSRASSGLKLMLWGFFQKVVISDAAELFIQKLFSNPYPYSGYASALATVIFAVRIYCDFAGYSNIAIGAAEILGFKLMRNFNHPYFSASIGDFWRRWHISLSTWLKDYIYIPLGGSRRGKFRHCLNLIITFLVSGLWHGARWTFVIWGAIHGVLSAIEAVLKKPVKFISEKLHLNKIRFITLPVRILFTFILVCFSWVFFRASTISDALYICKSIITDIARGGLFNGGEWLNALYSLGLCTTQDTLVQLLCVRSGLTLAICVGFMLLMELCEIRRPINEVIQAKVFPVRWAFCAVLLLAILFYGVFEASSFVYFQF